MKRFIAVLLAASMLCGLFPLCAAAQTDLKADKTYIVLTPGNFTDNGAWTVEKDSQTGYAYMIAGKDGKAVPDKPARINVAFPKDGSYKIYTFSKDFATDPGSRYFDVQIENAGTYRMGTHGEAGWHWQASEAISVKGGEAQVSVIDTRGNYARCAMIVLTDDERFNPGSEQADIKALAEKQYKPTNTDLKDIEPVKPAEDTEKKPAEEKPAEGNSKTEFKQDKVYMAFMPGKFTDNGAWTVETDKETGYSYMIAGKDGKAVPSKPAKTRIVLPTDGAYKIYAFSKDFDTAAGTRYFHVKLGDSAPQILGSHGKAGWHWQATEPIKTFGGETDFSVIDVTGNYVRCAMLVITDDLDFNPGSEKADLEAIAAKQYKEGSVQYSNANILAGRPDSEIAVKLNGNWMQFDVDPVILNDRTLVPFRAIFEALGCTVSWNDETQTATGVRNGMKVELPIGSNKVFVGGKGATLDQPAVLLNDRTLVPLRFVSESLGAQVKWYEDSQSIVILADIPQETLLFTMSSFTDYGTWIMESAAEGAFKLSALRGIFPSAAGAKPQDADASKSRPAVAPFRLTEGGTYKVWARSKDYANNEPGSRYFNIGFNSEPMMPHKYGSHGGTGFAWASGGTIDLKAGDNTLYVYDTSGFYARFDAVLLTKDLDYVPSEDYDTVCKTAMPWDNSVESVSDFPFYAKEQAQPTDSASIENEHTKVVFYKVPTSQGQVVQNEIYSKYNGEWVKTNNRNEELGYLVIRADDASYTTGQAICITKSSFSFEGKERAALSKSPFDVGVGTWFIPTDYVVNGDNSITLVFPANETGTMTAVWKMDKNTAPLVSIDTTFAKDGYYTIGAWEGTDVLFDEFDYAMAPYRVMMKRVPEKAELISEAHLFTPMATLTLEKNNAYSAQPVTKGVVVEPSWIPVRWVYEDTAKFGVALNSPSNFYRGSVFAPIMGSEDSKMAAGSAYNLQFRVISTVGEWTDMYEDTVTNLFEVTDYRRNYRNSLNEAIFNTRELVLDDMYSGWDEHDLAHYNMEHPNMTSVANSMQALQDYLLTEDEEMLTRRAIPTIANTLSRGGIHFYRKDTTPAAIGSPVAGFNLNVIGGMYEMTRGAVPFLHEYGVEKGMQSVTNSYGSIAGFSNDLNLYKYTGDKKYLDAAIKGADEYLETEVYAPNTKMPDFGSFIYISYYPNVASLLDIYEVTKDKKYLDAAEQAAHWMASGLWVPGVDGDRKTAPVMANDLEQMLEYTHFTTDNALYWNHGDYRFRIGRGTDLKNTATDSIVTDHQREVEGWIPSRVGLGIEQGSTFLKGGNIIMQSFVGDFMKLSAYTGNDFYATLARNAIIGRFRSYDGYYRQYYMTYQQETNYPYEGPDYTGIYWHHIPPFLAMLEDFLINQTFAWSGANISFPSLRQQGYAYFNSNQYGHEPGKFYDEADMWAWLDKGIAETNNIQIDWMAARKDGVLGLALMNEDDQDITTTVQLGEKVPGGASYTGTANLYDKSGRIGTVEVTNGAFSVTIPAKSLQAVTIQIAGVKAPAYSKMDYSATSAEIGGTVSDHTNGKGYALQMSPDCYYAYVYITDRPADAAGATMTYDIGGGEKKTVSADVYPYEFIVKVDDASKEFHYSVSVQRTDGSKVDLGGGTLMTAALSAQKGIKYEGKTPEKPQEKPTEKQAEKPSVQPSEAAKKLKFDSFPLTYLTQGTNEAGALRFVVNLSTIPFAVTENSMVGLPVKGVLIDGETRIPYETVVIANEMRDTDKAVLVLAPNGGVSGTKYPNNNEGRNHKFELTISPIQ